MGEVVITKLNGGLGRRLPTTDGICGLVVMMASIATGAQVASVYRLESVADAESLLIDEAHDTSTNNLVWHHINEFFRANPDGTLYLYPADKTDDYQDCVQDGIRALILETAGEVKTIGCVYNGAIQADGAATLAAITMAQAEANLAYSNHSPIQVVMDGHKFAGTEAVYSFNAKNVSVVGGQNLGVVNYDLGGAQPWEFHTEVGLVLGAISLAAVNESIAWVEKFNLFGGSLTNAAVVGASIVGQESLMAQMDDNGFITIKSYVGKSGLYFNGSRTATELTSDYANIQNNRVIDKAIRLIRTAMLPSLNSPINVDPTTGQLSPAVIKSFELKCRRALDGMQDNEEFSAVNVIVDADQNILSTSELQIQLEITPTGTAENISVEIGFINPFNS